MIKIELENGIIISIDGKEVMQADEFKERLKTNAELFDDRMFKLYSGCCKTSAGVKAEMLLERLEAINNITHEESSSCQLLGRIRDIYEQTKKDIEFIN